MHLCLRISEVLREIVDKLDPVKDHEPLTNMALACRAFYDPAMDVRWSQLPSLRPLLECLPEGVKYHPRPQTLARTPLIHFKIPTNSSH